SGLNPDRNNIYLHIEHMDTKNHSSEEYYRKFKEFMAMKYRDLSFSVILCSDNNAFDFMRSHHDELYPGVPVVFSGVNYFEDSMIEKFPDFTGIAEIASIRETVEVMVDLHPEIEEIYIINDYLKTGRAWQRSIAEELKKMVLPFRLRYNENLSMDELRAEIASLKEGTLILTGVYYADRDGLSYTYEKAGEMIASASSVPIYCLVDFNLTGSVVGGKVISGFAHGDAMASLAQRILAGESPEDIPVIKEGYNSYIFNHPGLERFGIAEKNLPDESLVINRPFSLYREYTVQIWLLAVIFGLLLVAALALGLNSYHQKQNEKTLQDLVESTWEGLVVHENGYTHQVNNVFLRMFGFDREDIAGQATIEKCFPPESLGLVRQKIREGSVEPYETMAMKKDGSLFPVEIRARFIDYKGRKTRVAAVRDLTHQKMVEEQISQSQKMQALGTLAGGVAHDFNNVLGGVLGYADLGRKSVDPGSREHLYFDQIVAAGTRARDLIGQILSFSRQSGKEKKSLNLSLIIKETLTLLKGSLPSTIEIRQSLDDSVCVTGNPVQLQQIVMNLCTNAGLAMKRDGGVLEMELKQTKIDDPSKSGLEIAPGRYAQLLVSDTGCGMSEEVKRRIFEPFFTTRETGEGTGMGLSVVHGIVREMKGSVTVYTSEGEGTTFNILLPLCLEGRKVDKEDDDREIKGGSERILFVDDEQLQVDLAEDLLGHLGYRVKAVRSSLKALELFRETPEEFDILISDVTMPEMTGDFLIEEVRNIRRDLPVLLCTGFSERLSEERLRSLGIGRVVSKPLLLGELAGRIREALEPES
ncbi:MAG: ATP-binding protein, partial [Spirochaetales bacterium]|nr:ATP-binding protein [Spirochaetales bacterium]